MQEEHQPMSFKNAFLVVAVVAAITFGAIGLLRQPNTEGDSNAAPPVELLNVSYDPTRELCRDITEKFIPIYEKDSGRKLTIKQSHVGLPQHPPPLLHARDPPAVPHA